MLQWSIHCTPCVNTGHKLIKEQTRPHHTVKITNAKWMIYTHWNRLYKFARFCKSFKIGLTIDFTCDSVLGFVRCSAVIRGWDYSLLSIATGAKLFDLYLYVLIGFSNFFFLLQMRLAATAGSFMHTSKHTKVHTLTHTHVESERCTHNLLFTYYCRRKLLRNFPSGD